MDTTELSRALREATEGLQAPPTLAAAVLRGGRRRRTHRRAALASGMAVVIAAAGLVVVKVTKADPPLITTGANPMLTTPTRGDLAGDKAYLDAAVTAFDAGMPNEPGKARLDRPHVYWAGTTDGGKVAVVVQKVERSDSTGYVSDGTIIEAGAEERSVIGLLVGTKPVLVNSFPQPYSTPTRGFAFVYGPNNRNVIALGAKNLSISTTWSISPTSGRAERDWKPMVERDGVWLGETGEPGPPENIRVVTGDPAKAGYDQSLTILPGTRWSLGTDRQAKPVPEGVLRTKPGDVFRVKGSTSRPLGDNVHETLMAANLLDPLAGVTPTGAQFIVDLPGGGSVVAIEVVSMFIMDGLFLAQRDAAAKITGWTYCGMVRKDTGGLVGVCELAGQAGRLAIAPGMALTYQVQLDGGIGGDWVDAGKDAALIPANVPTVHLADPRGRTEAHSLLAP
ncbi:hypothetical protein [Actinokineospora terrae]|uniref:Uncharacterized protein n=1 Tax=Actinokineospora terrae TaxID=155974 RepID=A0A1H9NTI4_9PSEU|nr:hypothetical protein [Actinokineospora terrae]SER39232.1 hypothetical protein SAMN04487818_103124 [Actinokineospora terrae]